MTDLKSRSERRKQRKEVKSIEEEKKKKSPLVAQTVSQKTYLSQLKKSDQVFATGSAGTGKTYIASRVGLRSILEGHHDRIIICRPTMADPRHRMGFLPGNLDAKLKPWLVPILRAFKDEASQTDIDKLKNEGRIEFPSFEHMRGMTFDDAFVILDEAQNCTFTDLKLFLTRIGKNSKVVVNGDLDQFDIQDSGLQKIMDMITKYSLSASVIIFDENDVVRSEIAAEWVKAFAKMRK